MSSGITFGPDQAWLVRSTLAEPVMRRVVAALGTTDPGLAAWVEQGIHFQSIDVDLLAPEQREPVRRAVAAVARELLGDDLLLRSVDVPGAADDADRHRRRRASVERLRTLAESDEARWFAAGSPP